jgi:hypothetical protein
MRRVLLMLIVGLLIASPGFSQYVEPSPPPSTTQGPPPPPPTPLNVLGQYLIKTDGKSGEYEIAPGNPSQTRSVEEHSEWHLTYRNINGASCLHTDVVNWQHITTTYDKTQDGSRVLRTTIETQTLVKGKSPNGQLQPNPCYLTANETYPLDGPATLSIIGYTPLKGPGHYKLYRALALESGSSLPQIAVDITTQQTGRPTTSELHILTASLDIERWDKAEWTTPYAGTITVTNDYDTYITPEGYAWLTIRARWNTQPK